MSSPGCYSSRSQMYRMPLVAPRWSSRAPGLKRLPRRLTYKALTSR